MTYCTLFILVLIAVASVTSTEDVPTSRKWFGGRKVSPGAQCRSRGPFGGVCKTPDPAERCLNMVCAYTKDHDIPMPGNVGPALQGTWCGDKKICLAGHCVDDPEPPRSPLVIDDIQYDCEEQWWKTGLRSFNRDNVQ